MSPTAPSQPATVIEVTNIGTVWRMTSNDGRFSGLFLDRLTAVRHARREAAWHPGHVVVIREESPGPDRAVRSVRVRDPGGHF